MKRTFTVVTLLIQTNLYATNITFGVPAFTGPACPSDHVSYALSPDNSSLSILFGSYYNLNTDASTLTAFSDCLISVPTHFFRDSVKITADFRGYHTIPEGGVLSRQIRYTPDNGKTTELTQSINGPHDDFNEIVSHQISVTCNQTKFFNLFVWHMLQAASANPSASFSLDSVDISEAMTPSSADTFQLCTSSASSISAAVGIGITLAATLLGFLS